MCMCSAETIIFPETKHESCLDKRSIRHDFTAADVFVVVPMLL